MGHYYDSDQYSSCPFCDQKNSLKDNVSKINNNDSEDIHNLFTVMDEINNGRELAKQLTLLYLENIEENDKTIGLFFDANNFQPVVGWLVCEYGPERGNSYKITSGRNFIGRSYKSDIVVYDDPNVSREKHCSIIFEPKTCKFYIMPSKHSITIINDNLLTEAVCISDNDEILIGKSKFRMIPYCKKGREWN